MALGSDGSVAAAAANHAQKISNGSSANLRDSIILPHLMLSILYATNRPLSEAPTEIPLMPDSAPEIAPPKGTLMQGKRGLIMGVANNRSIAWAIAQAVAAQGGELAFTYQGEALEKRVRPLASSIGADFLLPCDVSADEAMDAAFDALGNKWGK